MYGGARISTSVPPCRALAVLSAVTPEIVQSVLTTPAGAVTVACAAARAGTFVKDMRDGTGTITVPRAAGPFTITPARTVPGRASAVMAPAGPPIVGDGVMTVPSGTAAMRRAVVP